MGGQEGRVKRTQVRDADGWTVIAHSKGSRGPGSSSRSKNHAELKDAARPRDTVEGLTVSKLLDSFREHEARWRDSQCAKHLEGVLKTRMGDGVQEAVCVGVGSFSLDWEHRHRSMWQLVLFMAVVGLVTPPAPSTSTPSLPLYAQDPLFTPLDTAFLSALHITVLSTTIATHITPSSFLFAPFLEWSILLPEFLQDRNPALYVGNEILDDYSAYAAAAERDSTLLDRCAELGKGFLRERMRWDVRAFGGHATALQGLVVYLGKREDEDGDEDGG